MRGEMLYRNLGMTGEEVSVIGLGGSHLGQAQVPEDEALRLIHEGIDRGINFLEAVLAAKEAGKIRYIGFTGHKDPHIDLAMMEVAQRDGFHFDTGQMPINIMDAHFRSFSQLVVPEALRQNIAVLGMKCFGSGVLFKSSVLKDGMGRVHSDLSIAVPILL